MSLAMTAGVALGAVLYLVTPDAVTAWLGDGRISDPEIRVTLIAGHDAPETGPSPPGGPLFVASRTQLGICVRHMAGALSDDEKQRHVVAALTILRSAYPQWAAHYFTPASVLFGLTRPGHSPLLVPGVDRSAVVYRRAVVPFRDLASPFLVFMYVVSPGEIRHLFAGSDIMRRTYQQEVLTTSPGAHVAIPVSAGLYVTVDELRDRDVLSAGLARAFGLRHPSRPADSEPIGNPVPRATYR